MKNPKHLPKEPAHNEGNLKPDSQKIECRAYQLYQERGGEAGHDCEDWLRAERELQELGQVAMSH